MSYPGTPLGLAVPRTQRDATSIRLPSWAERGKSMWQDTLTELRRIVDALPINILIVGAVTSEQRDEALFELRAAHGRDAHYPQRTMPFTLPRNPTTIVVIEEVADLSPGHQQTLLWWLGRHREGMVLSFAVNPVFPLVSRGVLSENLFYRLNMITLSVDDSGMSVSGLCSAGEKS